MKGAGSPATSVHRGVLVVRIAKPLLLVTTPLGVLEGFYECYRLAGGLLFLMVAMVGVMGVALASVVSVIRHEERVSRSAALPPKPENDPCKS
jgi:hypothetical protein